MVVAVDEFWSFVRAEFVHAMVGVDKVVDVETEVHIDVVVYVCYCWMWFL